MAIGWAGQAKYTIYCGPGRMKIDRLKKNATVGNTLQQINSTVKIAAPHEYNKTTANLNFCKSLIDFMCLKRKHSMSEETGRPSISDWLNSL
ncbi:MAG: hypothetical protein HQL06_02145 [Nitrospirae bacterium]|nr:hypothetical protein [Nitrospirota bacterium]